MLGHGQDGRPSTGSTPMLLEQALRSASGTPYKARNRAEARQPLEYRIVCEPDATLQINQGYQPIPDSNQTGCKARTCPPPQARPSYRINGSLLVVIEDEGRGKSCPTLNRPHRLRRPHRHPCPHGCSHPRKSRFTRGSGSGSSSQSLPFLLLPQPQDQTSSCQSASLRSRQPAYHSN